MSVYIISYDGLSRKNCRMKRLFFDKIAHMAENDGMEKAPVVSLEQLRKWMKGNAVSRSALAKALDIQRSTVDNWFSSKRNSIPSHFHAILHRIIAGERLSPTEMKSQLVVPLSSHILNLAMREAVRANMKIEDWIAQAIEENASQNASGSTKRGE